jgi:hypothetical protein
MNLYDRQDLYPFKGKDEPLVDRMPIFLSGDEIALLNDRLLLRADE